MNVLLMCILVLCFLIQAIKTRSLAKKKGYSCINVPNIKTNDYSDSTFSLIRFRILISLRKHQCASAPIDAHTSNIPVIYALTECYMLHVCLVTVTITYFDKYF